jgi:phosphotriesterase-related protein
LRNASSRDIIDERSCSIMGNEIITVGGRIEPDAMGLTLPHEHILVDFIGADKAGKYRYDEEHVVQTMLPYLEEIKAQGVETFVDCTPMYLGRDPALLRKLSTLSGLNILTNTGQYKEPYLPKETFSLSAEELAASWIEEFQNGIGGTDVRPGFIKTASNPGPLEPIQRKITEAAALTSKSTNLTIATHTGVGIAAMEILDILDSLGVSPRKWIFVHAQNEEDIELVAKIAERGAWIELDGIGLEKEKLHRERLLELLERGYEDRILLSQDAGWYRPGEEPGGAKKPFSFLIEFFVPKLREQGVSERSIDNLMIGNPARAFAV